MALNHTVKGSVGYSVVGSPTIVDNVASGFSANDYLQLTDKFIPNTGDTWEFATKVNLTESNTVNFVLSVHEFLRVKLNREPSLLIRTDGEPSSFSGWSEYSIIGSQHVFSVNKNWYIKVGNDGTHFYFDYKEEGQQDYTRLLEGSSVGWEKTSSTFDGTTTLGFAPVAYSLQGSIDLNETYIKVNGQPWFGVCPVEVKKHQLMGPVGYTKVGSPTIVDGVVSGFSRNNCVQLNNSPDFSNPFEIVIAFTKNATTTGSPMLFDSRGSGFSGLAIYLVAGSQSRICLLVGNGGSSWAIDGTLKAANSEELIVGKKYYIKCIFDGESYTGYWKSDNTDWIVGLKTTTTAYPIGLSDNPRFGDITGGWGDPFNGSIDLNETYIKVNGKLWYYQPAPTKYIQKDDKLVFADPKIYIDDNGTKTYATPDVAPVPSGFTYGNTTTPSIGYVDMRTQAFTAAPNGATIGRDE